jgi:hypothetical protein
LSHLSKIEKIWPTALFSGLYVVPPILLNAIYGHDFKEKETA